MPKILCEICASWLERIGEYIKYVVLSLMALALISGGCSLTTVDGLHPHTENGMPQIAISCIIFAIALAIYSIGKLTKK